MFLVGAFNLMGLVVGLSSAEVTLVAIIVTFITSWRSKKAKVIEIVDDWEIDFGCHGSRTGSYLWLPMALLRGRFLEKEDFERSIKGCCLCQIPLRL